MSSVVNTSNSLPKSQHVLFVQSCLLLGDKPLCRYLLHVGKRETKCSFAAPSMLTSKSCRPYIESWSMWSFVKKPGTCIWPHFGFQQYRDKRQKTETCRPVLSGFFFWEFFILMPKSSSCATFSPCVLLSFYSKKAAIHSSHQIPFVGECCCPVIASSKNNV